MIEDLSTKSEREAELGKDFETIKKMLENLKDHVREEYRAEIVGIFGSYARGEQKETSDLDILVELEESAGIGLLKFINLENYLSDLLGVKVDLVMKSALKPRIGKYILKETVYLWKEKLVTIFRDAIGKPLGFVEEMSYDDFVEDDKTIFAVVRALEIIG